MSNVLTATDLRTLTLKDARAQTTVTERALLRGPERDRFASWLDRLEAEYRMRLTLLESDYHIELERRNGRLTDQQKHDLKQDFETKAQPLRHDLTGINARIDELTAPQDPPIVQLRKAITEPVAVKPEPSPVEQDITGWLNTKDAAIAYNVARSTINMYAQNGKVEAILIDTPTGKQYRIKPPTSVTVLPSPPAEPVVYPVALAKTPITLAQRLTELRQSYNLTLRQVAEFVGCDSKTINNLESGKQKTTRFAPQIATCYHVPVTELWPDYTEPEPSPIKFNTNAGNIVASLPPITQYEQDLIAKINQEEQNFAAAMMEADNLGNKLVESLSKPLVTVPATTMRIAIDFSPALWTIVILLAIIAAVLVLGQVQYYLP